MTKILIIEDDNEINKILCDFLTDNGYKAFSLHDGLHALDYVRENQPDLILLDIMLPFKSGDQVLSEIRNFTTIPVIIISARVTTQNKIDCLRSGADDYITKPFDLDETLARIESCLRRIHYQEMPESILQCKDLILDLNKNTASLKETALFLTAKEFGILALLMKYPDKVFSKSNLFESVWGTEYFCEDNTLNVHVSNLRNKLKIICPDEEYIDTVWGIGYRLHRS